MSDKHCTTHTAIIRNRAHAIPRHQRRLPRIQRQSSAPPRTCDAPGCNRTDEVKDAGRGRKLCKACRGA